MREAGERYQGRTFCEECDCELLSTYGEEALRDCGGYCPVCGCRLTRQLYVTPTENMRNTMDDIWDGEVEL